MPKRYLDMNVNTAAIERIKYTFDNFERIYLSFSAGKDSTIMLHLAMEEAKRRNQKIGILIVDLEGQYKLTMKHADNCFEMYKDYIESGDLPSTAAERVLTYYINKTEEKSFI